MRIALAGQGGVPGRTHFGYADTFHIFDIGADPPELLEIRANTPHCGDDGGDQPRLALAADLLRDCAAVLASAIGPCAREALSARDVVPIEYDGPDLAGAAGVIQAIRTHLNRIHHTPTPRDPYQHHAAQHGLDRLGRTQHDQIAGRRATPQEAAR